MRVQSGAVCVFVCLSGLVNGGCFNESVTSPPAFTVGPVVSENPNPHVPLVGIVTAVTDVPTTLEIQIEEGGSVWRLPGSAGLSEVHERSVLGLKPARQHALQVTAVDAEGNRSATTTLTFTPPALPEDFPGIEVTSSNPERMEPGVTLFALMRWPDGEDVDEETGLAIAVDGRGDVVWYRSDEPMWEDPHRLASGNLLGIVGYNRAEEVDMLGNVVARWHAASHPDEEANALVPEGSTAVAVETFHHDIQEMPSGNLLVLSTELRRVEDYPTAVDSPDAPRGPASVIGDVVIEFARDGTVVNQWKLMDMLDVYRLGYESLGGIWAEWGYGGVEGGTRDWSHANSVWYDAPTDSILVSLRHQEAVISFSRDGGGLNWILGTHEGWGEAWRSYLLTPEGDLEWQFHQHAAEVTDRGTLLLFDNGNFRAMPPGQAATALESYSRAVEYEIDPASMTVRQVWEYGPDQEIFYSPFISEADPLPLTGNVLITDGGRIRDEDGRPSDQIVGGEHWARVLEVTGGDNPQKVFEIVIDSNAQEPDVGWAVYRAERLPSLYPD